MHGRIIKGIAGFYYVFADDGVLYECKAKGSFRNESVKPLVGDKVEIRVTDAEKRIGNIDDIIERKNSLIRPSVANVDQAVIVFAVKDPVPNLGLLDRFLLMMNRQNVDTVIVFNKQDIDSENTSEEYKKIYEKSGCRMFFISVRENSGIEKVKELLEGKTTVLAGPSGVGKSSLMNGLFPEACAETGDISEKIRRGKNTTRHSELFMINENTFIMDTPGFSSLYVDDVSEEELKQYFPEFYPYNENKCRFNGCNHVKEPGCAIRDAVASGEINTRRYESYVYMFEELKSRKTSPFRKP